MSGMPLLLRAATREALALTGHLLLYPTGICAEKAYEAGDATAEIECPQPATEDPPPDPVLLLHGFCDNRSAFLLLRRSLLQHGWSHVFALNQSPLTWDIRTAAEELAPRVEEICERTGRERVDIVGHSLGGLIGRYYVQLLGGDARVRTLVTLGTPHAGTQAAAMLPALPLARQMRPHSDLIEELAAPAAHCLTRFVSVWSELDLFIVPAAAARLEHQDLSVRNVRMGDVGHLMLPVDRTVNTLIRAELSGLPGVEDSDVADEPAPVDAA